MVAEYKDVEVLTEIVRKAMMRRRLTRVDHANYAKHLQALVSDAPKFGPSVKGQMVLLDLPPTLNELLPLFNNGDSARESTRITRGLGLVRDRLVERGTTGDPGRHISPGSRANLGVPTRSSSWTGIEERGQSVEALRTFLPAAQSAIEELIQHLNRPGNNGGPILQERSAAVADLRALHSALGVFLDRLDAGALDDDLGAGLVAESVRVSARIMDNLRSDPLPYAIASLIFSGFTAFGAGDFGGFLSAAALTLATGKNQPRT